jgi:hypothetical protein
MPWMMPRRGGVMSIAIDARDAEERYLIEPVDNVAAENLFDRAWAITLLDKVLALLAAEYAESGRGQRPLAWAHMGPLQPASRIERSARRNDIEPS